MIFRFYREDYWPTINLKGAQTTSKIVFLRFRNITLYNVTGYYCLNLQASMP
jgi:hypothetical protein